MGSEPMTPSLHVSARAAMLLANVRLTTRGRVSENVRARFLCNIRVWQLGWWEWRGEKRRVGGLFSPFVGGQGNPDRGAPFSRAWAEEIPKDHQATDTDVRANLETRGENISAPMAIWILQDFTLYLPPNCLHLCRTLSFLLVGLDVYVSTPDLCQRFRVPTPCSHIRPPSLVMYHCYYI